MMRKQYTAAFKARVVQELLKEERTFAQIAAEYEVHPTQLKNWRAVALEGLPGFFEKQDSTAELRRAYEQQLTELYAEIGKLTTQVAWLKKSYNSDFANQWAETIQQAGEDSEYRTVKYWGELLITGLNDREEKPWEKWITMLSELLNHHKIDLKSRSSLLQFRASAYFNSQQYEQALVDLEQLTQIQPDYAWNWFLKAITLLQVGRREELSHAFARLDEVDPNFMPNLLRQYVEQLAAIGRSDEFIEELRSKIDEHDLLQNNRE